MLNEWSDREPKKDLPTRLEMALLSAFSVAVLALGVAGIWSMLVA